MSHVSSPFPQFYDKNLKIMTICRNCVWNVFFFWIIFSLEQFGSIRHRYPLLYVNMAQQPYLSCYVRYFYGHLLFIHQHISFIRHFFRGRILAEVSSGQKTHHNCCNLKHTMKKNCNTTSDALPTLSKKHACFMVPDNDFDIKKKVSNSD